MSNNEIVSTLTDLQELKRMREELDAEIEAAENKIKEHMTATGADTLTAGAFKVTWKPVTSRRLDTKAIMAAIPEFCSDHVRTTTTRRFTVS